MYLLVFTFTFCAPTAALNLPPGNASYDQFEAPTRHNTYITRATIRIIEDVYAPLSNLLAITCATNVSDSTRFRQAAFLNEVLRSTSARLAVTVEDADTIRDGVSRLRFFNVLLVDSYAAFERIFAHATEHTFDYTGLYTIILTESSRYQYDSITRIMQACWERHIINVIVLVAIDPLARSAVYTYFPYTPFHCEAVVPVIHNYYESNGFMYDGELFPKKLRNMYGCGLQVAAYPIPPFMMLEPAQRLGVASYRTDGIDGIVVRVLSQRLNFTAVVSVPSDGKGRGLVQENNGAVGMVLRNEANFTIGAIPFSARKAQSLSASFPYFQVGSWICI